MSTTAGRRSASRRGAGGSGRGRGKTASKSGDSRSRWGDIRSVHPGPQGPRRSPNGSLPHMRAVPDARPSTAEAEIAAAGASGRPRSGGRRRESGRRDARPGSALGRSGAARGRRASRGLGRRGAPAHAPPACVGGDPGGSAPRQTVVALARSLPERVVERRRGVGACTRIGHFRYHRSGLGSWGTHGLAALVMTSWRSLEGGDVGESAGAPRLGCEPHPGNSLVGHESELARTLALTAVFGRESELALAEGFREAADERFGVLGFEGEAGVGKATASGAVARRPGSVDSACSSAGSRRRSRSLRCAPSATCSSPARARPLPCYRSRSGGRLTSRCCGASRAGGRSRFRSASTLSWSAAVDRSG
jgi:hypothetical protein